MDDPIVIISTVAMITIMVFFYYIPVGLLINAWASGVRGIRMRDLIRIKLMDIPPEKIIECMIRAFHANVTITLTDLESHFLAGGSVEKVTQALIQAQKSCIDLNFKKACEIALSGKDVLKEIGI